MFGNSHPQTQDLTTAATGKLLCLCLSGVLNARSTSVNEDPIITPMFPSDALSVSSKTMVQYHFVDYRCLWVKGLTWRLLIGPVSFLFGNGYIESVLFFLQRL